MEVSYYILVLCLLLTYLSDAAKYDPKSIIETFSDQKEFRKLLRTKNNVLVLFAKSAKSSAHLNSLFLAVAEQVKGQATLAYIDCAGDGKKLCKKLKITPELTQLKHYKDGEFHKDYDRKETVQSMVNFLKDPSGDPPWDEDETATEVVHVPDASALGKILHKEKLPVMVMFYVPWCGYCKRIKPEFAVAAAELKEIAVFAAMDVNKAENAIVRQHFNISGFPTLLYFENGSLKYKYEGDNTKEGLTKFIKNPGKPPEVPKDDDWSDSESDVVHLNEKNFDEILKSEPSILIMFYAPWCGHCKKMKPEYASAAAVMKEKNIPGILAMLDATVDKNVAGRFQITGYPSVKYFKNGELAFDANVRTSDKIVEFMANPQEPPPPPPPELPWYKTESDVVHLNDENFKEVLKRKKHALVMFYAPWCGHCKKAKPEYQNAATQFKDDSKVELAAVDCTEHNALCISQEIQGYPTFKYFNYLKSSKPYDGGRLEKDFIEFMNSVSDPNYVPKSPTPEAKPDAESWWKDLTGSENIKHLKTTDFDSFVAKEESVLVMFYAQWCGHCKNLKPIYAEAALKMKNDKIAGVMTAVDVVSERELATKFDIKGFPTVKHFKNGKVTEDYQSGRTVEELVAYMKKKSIGTSGKEEL